MALTPYLNDQFFNDPFAGAMMPMGSHMPGTLVTGMDRQMRRMEHDMRKMHNHMGSLLGNVMPAQVHSLFDRHQLEPCIVDEGGEKKVQWHFDCSGFGPEDITVKTMGDQLEVRAKHEDKGKHHHQYREFARLVTIPEGSDIGKMRSVFSDKGTLTIDTPYQPPAAIEAKKSHREIPVKHESKKAIVE